MEVITINNKFDYQLRLVDDANLLLKIKENAR